MYRQFLAASLLLMILALPASAELTVSVTINGDLEEILPLLEHLRQQGPGAGGAEASEALKVEVHSLHAEPGAAPAPEDAAAPAMPTLGLKNLRVEPPTIAPSTPILLSVDVQDDARAVDTITARLVEANLEADVYDNGTNGDRTPGDGTWSSFILTPPDLAAGTYTVEFAAYDANGAPVTTAGADGAERPLTASIKIDAERPEAAEAPPAPEAPAESAPAQEAAPEAVSEAASEAAPQSAPVE